ncbi:MAG TPA: hypothetical protein VNG04_07460 [Candidatus Acidoferrum sp.]|nr:hypothetical protein [Candidatus Acidoferrum sp.]HXJ32352.1 hypothetical protein [Gemmatimonadales bacterium]
MPAPFQPMSLGFVIAIIVLVLVIVLSVLQGPSLVLGLIGALAVARMT